jgi:hypothetical protein
LAEVQAAAPKPQEPEPVEDEGAEDGEEGGGTEDAKKKKKKRNKKKRASDKPIQEVMESYEVEIDGKTDQIRPRSSKQCVQRSNHPFGESANC